MPKVEKENRFARVRSLESVVFEAIGAGSSCWEHVDRAGEFQSDVALAIGYDAVDRIRQLLREAFRPLSVDILFGSDYATPSKEGGS